MISIQRKTNLHTADSELTGGVNTTARPARPDIPSNERATRYFIIVFFFKFKSPLIYKVFRKL